MVSIIPGGYTAPSPTESSYTGDSKKAIERRRKIAESLISQATEYQPSAHWATAIAKGLQGLVGGYQASQADKADADINRRLAEAIRGGNLDEMSRVGMETGSLEPSDYLQLKTAETYRTADREFRESQAKQQRQMDVLNYNLRVKEANQPYALGENYVQDQPLPYMNEGGADPAPSQTGLAGQPQPLQEQIPPGYPGTTPGPGTPSTGQGQPFSGGTRVVGRKPIAGDQRKAVIEAEDAVAAADGAIRGIDNLLTPPAEGQPAPNETAGGGWWAGVARPFLAANDPTAKGGMFENAPDLVDQKAAEATNRVVSTGYRAIMGAIKDSFGAMPSNAEREFMVKAQSMDPQTTTPDMRRQLMEEGRALMVIRRQKNIERAQQIRGGTYFQPGGGMSGATPPPSGGDTEYTYDAQGNLVPQ